ncbi:MAG TPA: hypothetical protein VN812_14855, partial [Candidatus Acidoferrales bacterium]|nr:hypothetical protein [Candidatus Acidoferrales bacterium]
ELLGIMPTIHVHPSWQILVPPNQFGNFQVSYKLTTTSSPYTDSQVYTQTVTNIQPANPTPTPTPTAAPASHCPGDCNDDGKVTVDELLRCVNMALTGNDSACPPCDVNGDGAITVDEILTAVTAALDGCPTPVPATLQMIQDTIFTPRCAIGTCHDAASATENLNLSAGAAFGQLINVPSAENPAMPRVDPGNPSNSFLLVKVQGPPPGEGSLMPLTGAPLSPDQIQLIRNWILQGANP